MFKRNKAVIILLLLSNAIVAFSQAESEDGSRGLKPREYAKVLPQQVVARRRKKDPVSNQKPQSNNQTVSYQAADDDESVIEQGTDVGFTFWRLTEPEADDRLEVAEKQRIAVRQKDKVVEKVVTFVPKRAESSTEFADGDALRFTLELSIEGYVYIINREQYADGSYSDPYLIFPSKIDIAKTDRAIPNKLLFIPNEQGFFQLQQYGSDKPAKVAEVFTLLISPQPLKELPPLDTEEPRVIEKQKFNQWTKEWAGRIWKFEQQRGVGLSITKAEKDANVAGKQLLSADDNLPQTIYHVAHKPGRPFLLTIPMKIRNR